MTTMTITTGVKTFALVGTTVIIICLAIVITIAAGASVPPTEATDSEALKYIRSQKFSKMILDVDAGVDDATAMFLALTKPRSEFPEVIAITCTHGNTNITNVVINVLRTLKVLNLTIPVYMGASKSLLVTPEGDEFFGKDGFGDVPDPFPPSLSEAQEEHAAVALTRLARKHAGDLGVIALGPLTNLAMAQRLDPEFKKNVNCIYWMGGSLEGIGNIKPGIEFNAFMDPESNYIVFNATGPPIITVSWETCLYHGEVSTEWRIYVLGNVDSPAVNFLNRIEAKSLRNKWPTCDAKAMAVLLDPTVAIKAVNHHMEPIYQGDGRGSIMVDYKDSTGKPKNSVIVTEIDAEKFKTMCLEILSAS